MRDCLDFYSTNVEQAKTLSNFSKVLTDMLQKFRRAVGGVFYQESNMSRDPAYRFVYREPEIIRIILSTP